MLMPAFPLLLQMTLRANARRQPAISRACIHGSADMGGLDVAYKIVLMIPVRRALATPPVDYRHGAMGALVCVLLATMDGWMVGAENIRCRLTWVCNHKFALNHLHGLNHYTSKDLFGYSIGPHLGAS
jgi:hypothetical protein